MALALTAYDLAMRFVGVKETPGVATSPLIAAMLSLDTPTLTSDEIPWCSAFLNFIAWLYRLPRSKSLAARSWLQVGVPIALTDARVGFDIVVFNRGGSPDPDVHGPGHVAFFARLIDDKVEVLGGNQANAVGIARFPTTAVLGVRRLA